MNSVFRALLLLLPLLITASGTAAADPPDRAAVDHAHRQIAGLIDDSGTLSLPARVERAFMLTLHAADAACSEGQHARAMVLLRTFMFEVRGVKRAQRLREDVADALIARAERAMAALNQSAVASR